MRRFKEIWKETIKKHLRKWRRLPGLAFEGLNNAGAQKKGLIVILNDNKMSIDKPVGAMSTYLTKLLSSKSYSSLRNIIKKISSSLPKNLSKTLRPFSFISV